MNWESIKTYCMEFIRMIDSHPDRKAKDYSFDLSELHYTVDGLRAVYLDTVNVKRYEIFIKELKPAASGNFLQLVSKL